MGKGPPSQAKHVGVVGRVISILNGVSPIAPLPITDLLIPLGFHVAVRFLLIGPLEVPFP